MCTEAFAIMCFESQPHVPVNELVQFCLFFHMHLVVQVD